VRLLVAAADGALLTLAFAPFGFWPLAIACPLLLMWLWRDASPCFAAWLGFVFGFGCFAAGTWWIYISVHDINAAPIWLALLLQALLAALMALYYALLGYVAARWLPARGAWRALIGLPALWLLLEWLRSILYTGFPWLSLGYAVTDTPLASLAPVLGVYGLSGLLLLSAGAVLVLLDGSRRERLCATLVLLTPWLVSIALQPVQWTSATGAPVTVAVTQGAIPQNIKWLTANRAPTRATYKELNRQALGARLIVWPEAAVTELANQIPQYLAGIYDDARSRNSDVVMGVLRVGDNSDRVYNSIMTLTDPLAFYDKRHLVPYSEYFPVPEWVRGWLRRLDLPYQDISKGSESQPLLRAGGLVIAATICYEDAFGNAQRHLVRDADVLVNVTNDAWFGHSPARYQHFQINRMRALEAQRYLIRAANDGVSAIVGPDGRVVQQATEFRTAVLRGTVTPRRGLTPYIRMGDWPALTLAALGAILAVLKRGKLTPVASTVAKAGVS
jgi:apolipoprotein N-acyltransferase